jgi:hypothetical protein
MTCGGVGDSVRSILKDGGLPLSRSYQRGGSGAQTSMGSMSKMLQCDLSPVFSRRLATRMSVNHLLTTLRVFLFLLEL